MGKELSILIPARSEMWLARTVEDILAHREADTEIIVVLDGEWASPPLPTHERLIVVKTGAPIGQRAATNLACRLARGRYVMKVDAHCAFDQGFDRKMLEAFAEAGDDVTMVPTMRNLHVFDWVCDKCESRWYQGPTPTFCLRKEGDELVRNESCDSASFHRDVVWNPKRNPQSNSFCFDATPHFQYFNEHTKLPGWKRDLVESMSIQGSCFMLTKERYWELNISDESFGSWGSQGIEVACKTWLSGGRILINRRTWYAHLFRTQGGDFGFPYPQSEDKIKAAKAYAREQFFEGKWPGAVRPLSWLVEKFWPVKGWTEEDLANLKAR